LPNCVHVQPLKNFAPIIAAPRQTFLVTGDTGRSSEDYALGCIVGNPFHI